MMDSAKRISTWLLILSVSALTTSQLDSDGEIAQINVEAGETVDLQCGDNRPDNTGRSWSKGDQIWSFLDDKIINNDQVSLVNRSAIMRIVNVTLDGEGYYTCTAYTQPKFTRTLHLQVKEKPCEAPQKPSNGVYESDTDGATFRTGNTIRYRCDRGHRLIGESNRTCTGTSKGWQPPEPYCEPEYIGRVLSRLNGIEDRVTGIESKVTAIEKRITLVENNTSKMGDKISAIDNKVLTNDRKTAKIESRLTSAFSNIASLHSFHRPISTDGTKVTCTNDTELVDEKTVFQCMTMGARDGHSVSVYKWVVEEYNSKVSRSGLYYSQQFYQTIPGYKLVLRGRIFSDGDIRIALFLLPGVYDDQLTWPFSKNHDLTVLMNNGTEILHRSFSSEQPECRLNRTTISASEFYCYTINPKWWGVWPNKTHILDDGSVVIKLYLYN